MMHFRNHADSDFLIAHFQGGTQDQLWAAVMTLRETEISVPADVTVITFASRGAREPLLVQQLEAARVPYINAARDVIGWRNPMKISLACKALDEVRTPYVLVADGNDVMLTGPLNEIHERFWDYDRDVLFGATKTNHPPVYIDKVERRDWMGEFRYLNAGTCFGKTDAVRAFYRGAETVMPTLDNPWDSEQFVIRHAFAAATDWVGFDWKCSIFQTFAKANIEQIDDVVRIS